jgi:hypothetical protein
MICIKCDSRRILYVRAKCSDQCYTAANGNEVNGYVPNDMGLGGGDYIEISLCMDCGQVQSVFPLPETRIERGIPKPEEESKEDIMRLLDNI